MAAPVPIATAITEINSDATSHPVNLPTGSNTAGRRVVVFLSFDSISGGRDITVPSGWTKFSTDLAQTDVQLTGMWRNTDGSEGATATVTISAGEAGAHIAVLYEAGDFNPAIAPFVSSGATGTSASPDPDSLNTGESRDYGWWAVAASNRPDTAYTANPTNYGNNLDAGAGPSSAAGVRIRAARRELTAQTENPGPFTIATSRAWNAFTVAIAPPDAADPHEGAGHVDGIGELEGAGHATHAGDGSVDVIGDLEGQGATSREGAGAVEVIGELEGSGQTSRAGSGSVEVIGELEGAGRALHAGEGHVEAVLELEGAGLAPHQGSGVIDLIGEMKGDGFAPGCPPAKRVFYIFED